jgi:radical SAM protein with 4Fe4S-binding SPASM domain
MEEAYGEVARIYVERKKAGQAIFINAFAPAGSHFQRGRCKMGLEDFSVDIEGDIFPCCCFVDRKVYRLGNVREGVSPAGLEAFMRDRALLDRHLEERHAQCPETSLCRKGCGCTNMVTSGKLDVVDAAVCEYGGFEDGIRRRVAAMLENGL